MNLQSLRARAARLDELSRGLGEELNRWKGCQSPLLPPEQTEYVQQVRRAKDGIERARAALLRAIYRLAAEVKRSGAPRTP
jgi:hypothetical protein